MENVKMYDVEYNLNGELVTRTFGENVKAAKAFAKSVNFVYNVEVRVFETKTVTSTKVIKVLTNN